MPLVPIVGDELEKDAMVTAFFGMMGTEKFRIVLTVRAEVYENGCVCEDAGSDEEARMDLNGG